MLLSPPFSEKFWALPPRRLDDVEDVGDVERCRAMSGDVEAMSRVSRMSRVSSDVEQPRHHDSQYASTSDYECAKLN